MALWDNTGHARGFHSPAYRLRPTQHDSIYRRLFQMKPPIFWHFPKVVINNKSLLVQVMGWSQTGDTFTEAYILLLDFMCEGSNAFPLRSAHTFYQAWYLKSRSLRRLNYPSLYSKYKNHWLSCDNILTTMLSIRKNHYNQGQAWAI